MGIEDLELEFEDENEESKQTEAVDIGVDLSFAAHDDRPQAHDVSQPHIIKSSTQTGIRVPDSKHDKSAVHKVPPKEAKVINHPQNKSRSSENHQISAPRQQVSHSEVRNTNSIQNLSDIEKQYIQKFAKLEAEKNIMIEIVSNSKLLDFQITQILMRIHAKNPALKKETQQIKKYLTEFLKTIK